MGLPFREIFSKGVTKRIQAFRKAQGPGPRLNGLRLKLAAGPSVAKECWFRA